MASRFYRCSKCGKIVGVVQDSGGQLVCCGQPMEELTANTTDAAQEKHVPVPEVNGSQVTVKVGSVSHPMTPEHYSAWVHLQTKQGGLMRRLTPEDKPEAVFVLAPGDEPVAAFAYCNLHGLWKADI